MSRLQNFLSILRAKWGDLLTTEAVITERGFIGPVPYLLYLRWLILLGIFLRFMLHKSEYRGGQWILVLSLIGVTGLLAFTATYLTAHTSLRRSKRIRSLLVAADVLLISIFYYLTKTAQSDFFLFYFLPIFVATEYLSGRSVLVVPVIITGAFAGVICLLFLKFPDPDSTLLDLFLRVFLPREVFFLSVAFLSLYLRQLERVQREKLSQREADMQTLLDFKVEIDQIFSLNQVLELAVRKAVHTVGAEGGHISLVNFKTGQIELRSYTPRDYLQGEGAPAVINGYASQVVQQGRTIWLQDVRSDSSLSEAIDPSIQGLLYMPIIAHNTVLGVLGIGSSSPKPFDEDAKKLLLAQTGQVASAIERARLLTALRDIGDATASTLILDFTLSSILHELTASLGFEFATVSLIDDYRGTIEMVRGKNVPPGWIRRSKYSLDHKDILADIVRTKKTEVITGWDDRFNPEIYERFGHADMTRVFTPLVADGSVVGVIEAGCQSERQAEIIFPEKLQTVEKLGQARGKEIARARPYVLLEIIADRAIKIIGADSASIHVFQFNQLLLEAGAGKATKEFLRKFPPRSSGFGRKAIRTREHIVIDDPRYLAVHNADLYDEGVRAMAAFPLDVGGGVRGILYVHFWREHTFSQAELELEIAFARQLVSAIQTNLLLKSIAEATERAWALSGLQNVIQSLASTLDLAQVLEDVAQNLLYMLDADNVTLYQFFEAEKRFEVPPVMNGKFRYPDLMMTRVHPDDIVWEIVENGRSFFVSNTSRELTFSAARKDGLDQPRFVEREGIKSSAVVVLKTGKPEEIVGLMFANYRTSRRFEAEDRRIINALASSAAIAIKTARLYDRASQELRRRSKELETLRAVDQAIVARSRVPDLQQLLELILDKGLEIIGAPVGEILWYNRWENFLELRVERGSSTTQRATRQNIGEGIVGWVAEKREPALVHNVKEGKWAEIYKPVFPDTHSELAVPLEDETGLLAVLNMEHPEIGAFSEDDRDLLETLAIQAVIAIHTVELYQRLERQMVCWRSLGIIATRIQVASYELDTVLRLILTGVTAGSGLGYSRCMLFLTNDDGIELHGRMAIGAQTREEAEAIWKMLDEETDDFGSSEDVLTSLLDKAQKFSVAILEGREKDQPLSIAIQQTSIPIEEGAGAPAVCVIERMPVIVKSAQPDPFRKIIEQVSKPGDEGYAFVCVPVMGKTGAIGVLVVDNRFLLNEREIEEDTSNLEAFANVIAMSIENAHLQTRLVEEQRLEAWKEFTARIAHTIGTRIAVIEGFVTKLRFALLEREGLEIERIEEDARTCLEDLTNGIHKAKMVLTEFRKYAMPLELTFERLDLVQVVKGVIREVRPSLDFPIELILLDESLFVQGDPLRLSDAFFELIRNAQEAMEPDADREPQMTITVSTEISLAGAGAIARIEFANTGPGILIEYKKRIFEPFFSTKGLGSGLGLVIVKSIIEEHKGTIEEIGKPDADARFVVRLPMIK